MPISNYYSLVFSNTQYFQFISITDNAHYLSNVMRVKAGYMFRIFNAIHGEYLCRIKNISKSKHTDSINCEVIRYCTNI